MSRHIGSVVTAAALVLASSGVSTPLAHAERPSQSSGAGDRTTAQREITLEAWVEREVESIFFNAEGDNDLAAALDRAIEVRDVVIAAAGEREAAALVNAERAVRILSQLERWGQPGRAGLLRSLLDKPRFLDELAFLIGQHDDIAQVFVLAQRLLDEAPGAVDEFGALAAAICVVHDGPYSLRVNRNITVADDPLELFGYFAGRATRLRHDPREMPAELLIYVVDATASVPELRWAASKYNPRSDVGDRYFEINYDHDFLRNGERMRLDRTGRYDLEVIRRHGGVCADQAYYARSVGQALGVPCVWVSARGTQMGHAWVGSLEVRGRRAAWDLDSGRYEEYQNLLGTLTHPQDRRVIDENELSLASKVIGVRRSDHRAAASYVAAAGRLAELRAAGKALPTEAPEGVELARRGEAPGVGIEDELTLIERGLRLSPAYLPGWNRVIAHAEAGRLDTDQMQSWFAVVERLAGESAPYFAVDALLRMAEGVDTVEAKHDVYEFAWREHRSKSDLASRIRIRQGDMWRAAGDRNKAWLAYQDIVDKYAADSAHLMTALRHCEAMLVEAGKRNATLEMYERAFRRIPMPGTGGAASAFSQQSNWHQCGTRLVYWYRRAGMQQKADNLHRQLNPDD